MNVQGSHGGDYANVTIASGQTVSSAAKIMDANLLAIELPAAFTGTVLTFQVSADGVTYQVPYTSANAAVTIATVAQGRSYPLPTELLPWSYLKVVSGTAEGGARVLKIVKKR